MTIATLYLAGRAWLPICGAVLAGMLVVTVWSYLRTEAPRGLRAGCAALKLLGTTLLLLCLLEPMWTEQRAKPGANVIALIADNSLSMKLREAGEASTRGDKLREVLTGTKAGWRTTLTDQFQVRNYLVDSRLSPTTDFSDLNFAGRSSNLGQALRDLRERTQGQPLAGIILLTDGVAPDLAVADLGPMPPVHSVVLGGTKPERDVALASTTVSQTAFEDTPVSIQADVSTTGLAGEEVVARLFQLGDTPETTSNVPIAEQTLRIPENSGNVSYRFQMKPEKSGVSFYRIETARKNAQEEATQENNQTVVSVDRGAGAYRILYVSGRPNWEYKFLHRALASDTQTQLVGLIRIAKREPKFEFRGRAGESSNPLFRGFGNQSKEEIERYDRPVFVRLNTQDEFELRDGFPKTAEDLFKYRAIVIDDVEAEFFTAEQMMLIQRFVSDRGGGFLMLGGAESFADGKFARTGIGDLLPVYVDQGGLPPPEANWQLNLTREGWLQPWARLRTNEADERGRLGEVPPFGVMNRIRAAKPAATVVATISDGTSDYPALVTQRFGRGRSAALLIGDFWHAGLGEESRQKDLGKAWRQLTRWLVADVPDRVELRAEPAANGQDVQLQVRVRDETFQPTDNATVTLEVRPLGSTQPVTLTAEASSEEPGLYRAIYAVRESGGFRVEAKVIDGEGGDLGKAASGWSSDLETAEFRSLTPNRELLTEVAQRTGGEVVDAADLDRFARSLPTRKLPVTETSTHPLWHTPWMLLLALGMFVGEWGLRRLKGLA